MLREILELYTAGMAGDVRTPVPHLFGPPGCGKSTYVAQAAEMLGVKLHTMNVSRINPLELEGVQMPRDDKLQLMLATHWNNLEDGDILFFDEFLRGFPEVYNGLLDIFTSRTVAGHQLPKVFIIAASNSTASYDAALADRLMHIPAPDPRKQKDEFDAITSTLVQAIGLHPSIQDSDEMNRLMSNVIEPMYNMLDSMKGAQITTASTPEEARSQRNIIGQAQLRRVVTPELSSLIDASNQAAMQASEPQYFLTYNYKRKMCHVPDRYLSKIEQILSAPEEKVAPQQRENTRLNIELIAASKALKEAENV